MLIQYVVWYLLLMYGDYVVILLSDHLKTVVGFKLNFYYGLNDLSREVTPLLAYSF